MKRCISLRIVKFLGKICFGIVLSGAAVVPLFLHNCALSTPPFSHKLFYFQTNVDRGGGAAGGLHLCRNLMLQLWRLWRSGCGAGRGGGRSWRGGGRSTLRSLGRKKRWRQQTDIRSSQLQISWDGVQSVLTWSISGEDFFWKWKHSQPVEIVCLHVVAPITISLVLYATYLLH